VGLTYHLHREIRAPLETTRTNVKCKSVNGSLTQESAIW
jgi:hypothetical protein